MIDVNSIIELPDDHGWRVINFRRVEKFNNTYVFELVFQRVISAMEIWKSKKAYELRDFSIDETHKVIINVSFARLFPIGSIWFRDGKYRVILPDYFGKYVLNESIFEGIIPFKSHINKYIKENDIPTCEMASEAYSWIVSYELEQPIYHNKKKKGYVPLDTVEPWKKAHKTHFIAFYSAEIYRYFYTGSEISDVSERMLYPLRSSVSNPYSLHHVPTLEELKMIPLENEHPVFFKKVHDSSSLEQIGNYIHLANFRSDIHRFRNAVNSTDDKYPMGSISKLPFSSFSRFRFCAKRVTRTDGKKGLLVMLIDSYEGYRKEKYTPVFPEKSKKDKSISPGGSSASGGQSGNDEENVVPGYNSNGTASVNSPEENINLLGIEGLLGMNSNIENQESLRFKVRPDGETQQISPLDIEDDDVRSPGSNPQAGGKRAKVGRWVNLFNYFDLIPEIVSKLIRHDAFQRANVGIGAWYFNHELDNIQLSENSSIIFGKDLKTVVHKNKSRFALYVVCLKLSSERTFYLFEKVKLDKKGKQIPTQSRTLLYSSSSGNGITNESLVKLIKVHLGFRILTTLEEKQLKKKPIVYYKFNHKHEKKIKKDEKTLIHPMTENEAIENHVDKISRRILESLKTPN